MKRYFLKPIVVMLVLCMTVIAGSAFAADFALTALRGCMSLPDGAITETPALACPAGSVQVWGLKITGAAPGVWLYDPSQALVVPDGDTTLNITLTNTLGIPVSLWLPGQTMTVGNGPVWFSGPDAKTLPADPYASAPDTTPRAGDLTKRVRSFALEAAANNGIQSYSWTVKPGTFILQSGTQPGLQVPMGLYGAVKVQSAGYAGIASATPPDALLMFSELDPVFNNYVTYANAGQTSAMFYTLPTGEELVYKARYFLLNGKPFTPAASALDVAAAASTTLVRLANASVTNRTAMILGEYLTVQSEDGERYPVTKRNDLNTVLLTAGKTIDATFAPAAAGYYPIFDRRLGVANSSFDATAQRWSTPDTGGIMTYLRVPSGVDAALNVTTTVAGPGTPTGKVVAASAPGGISCSTGTLVTDPTCTEVTNANTVMALKAVPDAGFTYRWTTVGAGGCAKATGPCELTTASPTTTINAEFRILSNLAVFRAGDWYIDIDGNGIWSANDSARPLGQPGDIPVSGDWNGNGISKVGVFRNGDWYLDTDGNGSWSGCGLPGVANPDTCSPLGQPGDLPVVGDWNGNGISKIGVFRNGDWYLDTDGNGSWSGCGLAGVANPDTCSPLGQPGDIPVVGDWNGNGLSKIGVFRNGDWFLDYNNNGVWDGCGAPADPAKDWCPTLGQPGDIPVTGDWNRDGKTKIGVFRGGDWYLDYNNNGVWDGCGAPADATKDLCATLGQPSDIPVTGNW